MVESRSGRIGPITLDVKCAGARSAGNPHAACDVAGVGNGATERPKRARKGKPWIQTRPILVGYRANSRPYQGYASYTLAGSNNGGAPDRLGFAWLMPAVAAQWF